MGLLATLAQMLIQQLFTYFTMSVFFSRNCALQKPCTLITKRLWYRNLGLRKFAPVAVSVSRDATDANFQ